MSAAKLGAIDGFASAACGETCDYTDGFVRRALAEGCREEYRTAWRKAYGETLRAIGAVS